MAEQHGQELSPTRETSGMTLGLMFPNGLLKLQPRKQLEYLRKNAAYSTQGGFLLRLRLFWSKTNLRQRGSAFIHFPNANLDKPVACHVSTLGFFTPLGGKCWFPSRFGRVYFHPWAAPRRPGEGLPAATR